MSFGKPASRSGGAFAALGARPWRWSPRCNCLVNSVSSRATVRWPKARRRCPVPSSVLGTINDYREKKGREGMHLPFSASTRTEELDDP